MAQYGFFYDNTRCTGCKTCVMACKDYYDSPLDIARRKVYDIEGGQWKGEQNGAYETDSFLYHLSIGCQHCDNPACVDACPTTAMHKDPKDGIVKVDTTKCMGCGYCVMAWPCRQVRGMLGAPGCGQDARVRERLPVARARQRPHRGTQGQVR